MFDKMQIINKVPSISSQPHGLGVGVGVGHGGGNGSPTFGRVC